MIVANELRIGNWVDYVRVPYNVWAIRVNSAELDSEEADNHITRATYDKINPIFLTEEWLLKFGFIDNGSWEKGDFEISQYGEEKGWRMKDWVRMPFGIEIKYVHQLQNLYFALTGQELEIIPEKS